MGRFLLKRLAALLCLCGLLLAAGPPGVWLDVPFFRQPKEGCGAASIAMVMEYWAVQQKKEGPFPDIARIQKQLHSSEVHGIYASDVGRYLQEHGFRVVIQGPEKWDNLRMHLQKGRPLIVALKPAEGKWLHY